MLNDLLSVAGIFVLAVGTICVGCIAYRWVEKIRFETQEYELCRLSKKVNGLAGWNVSTTDIPDDKRVVAIFKDWADPEICKRIEGRLVGRTISFEISACTGWLELPES